MGDEFLVPEDWAEEIVIADESELESEEVESYHPEWHWTKEDWNDREYERD